MAKIKTPPRHRGHDRPFRPKRVSRQAFAQVYWPYIPVIAVIVFLLSMMAHGGAPRQVAPKPSNHVLAYASSMSESKLLQDTNQQRSNRQLTSLNENSQLDAAAAAKAQDMAARDYWSHSTPDGSPPWIFTTNQGYKYQKLGENLAAGFDNEQTTIDGWMASPSHRENLLDPSYSDVGFGVAQIKDYQAAGGGPMTIVVAFYGQPGAGQAGARVQGAANSGSVSFGQVALAKLPLVGLITDMLIFLAALAVGTWLGRHIFLIKKALKKGERYALHHPLLDVGLIVIAVLSYLLSGTAGLIH